MRRACWRVLPILLPALGGCGGGSTDLVAAGRVRTGVKPSAMLDVAPPAVTAEAGNLVVAGTVTRRPGFDGVVPGRLSVTVLAADGRDVLDQFYTGWDPRSVPTDGDRRAAYRVRYGWLPPDGSTVRVTHEPNPWDTPETNDDGGGTRLSNPRLGTVTTGVNNRITARSTAVRPPAR